MKPSPSTFTTLRKHFFFSSSFFIDSSADETTAMYEEGVSDYLVTCSFSGTIPFISPPPPLIHTFFDRKKKLNGEFGGDSTTSGNHLPSPAYFYFQETLAKGEFSVCTRCFFIISKVEVPYSSSTQYDSDGFISIAAIQNEDINNVILSCFIFNLIAVLSCHIFYWLTFYLRHSKIDYNIYTKCMLD